MMPNDPKLVEAIILACLERNPVNFRAEHEGDVPRVRAAIKRGVTEKGAEFRPAVNRNPFLCGCLDFTESLPEEHLIVGYGYRPRRCLPRQLYFNDSTAWLKLAEIPCCG